MNFPLFFFSFFFCISILSELWSSCSWRCILSASTVMNCTGNKHESFGDDIMYDVILLKHRTRAASFRSASCSPFCSFRCRISSLSHTISFAAKQIKVIHSSCKTRMMAITDYTRKRTRASRIKRKPCRSCVIVLPMIKLICLLKAGFVFYCFLFRFLFFVFVFCNMFCLECLDWAKTEIWCVFVCGRNRFKQTKRNKTFCFLPASSIPSWLVCSSVDRTCL